MGSKVKRPEYFPILIKRVLLGRRAISTLPHTHSNERISKCMAANEGRVNEACVPFTLPSHFSLPAVGCVNVFIHAPIT